jgi:hypothetical protein
MYSRDYDETFPPMKDRASYEACIRPYLDKGAGGLLCPLTREPYAANPRLDRYMQVWSIAKAPMIRDAKPHVVDGKTFWMVAYADGHVDFAKSEPVFDKPAPMQERVKEIVRELKRLRVRRTSFVDTIRELEAEEAHLKKSLSARRRKK